MIGRDRRQGTGDRASNARSKVPRVWSLQNWPILTFCDVCIVSWEEQSDEVLLVIRITEQLANTLPHFSPHYCLSLHTLLYCRQLCASQFLAAFHLSPCREENTWDLRRRNVTISVKVWCPAVSGRASAVAVAVGRLLHWLGIRGLIAVPDTR